MTSRFKKNLWLFLSFGLLLRCWPQPASNSITTITNAGQQTKITSWSLGNIFKKDTADLREFGPSDFDDAAKFAGEQADKHTKSSDLQDIAKLF